MCMRGIISVQGWDLLRKNNKFLLVVFVCIGWCVGLGADAVASCEPGYYTICSRDPGNYDNCTDCECVPCGAGYTSNGLGVVYESACNMPSNSGCYKPPCAGHDFPCPSYFSENMRCKKLDYACPSGCGVYSVCNIQNGEIVYSDFMDGSCHIEGNGTAAECQPNTVSCGTFPLGVLFSSYANQSDQVGEATWQNGAWDTAGCHLNVVNKSVSTITVTYTDEPIEIDVRCNKFNVEAVSHSTSIPTIRYSINYNPLTRMYCAECKPGYLPNVQASPVNGVYASPGDNSSYGVIMCDEQVHTPNYAPGCTINYPLNSSSIPSGCKMPCPEGMETIENGATSINDCVPDVNQPYSDGTGTFTLGTERCP